MLIGQTTGAADSLTGVAALVAQVGISAIFIWLWYTERKDSREKDKTILGLLERALPALAECTDVLDRVQSALASQVERGTPDHRAVDMAVRRVELIADELGATLRQTRRRKEDYDDGR